ncbi:hypothetical protein E2C01_071186 [Portunus trituberculatus]|uniref:Uncharacterized protein n=1 Tax=Portunus trituberculatus TaxID=210409 RepID=A0A5B7I5K6_PORTR|nr:hypothetical protein [Portunus trituberculatus]
MSAPVNGSPETPRMSLARDTRRRGPCKHHEQRQGGRREMEAN